MKEQKAALIEALFQQMQSNEKAAAAFKKEFKLDDKEFEKMAKKLLDLWLDSPELIMMLSEMLGIYAQEGTSDEDDAEQDYLG